MVKYQALLSSQNEIRIFHLHSPDGNETRIVGTLDVVSLNDSPGYTALSYCWYDEQQPDTKTITLNGQDHEISGSLYVALTHARESDKHISLWVDALCINQEDLEERSLQVQLMTTIYRSAQLVLAWVGTRTPGEMTLREQIDQVYKSDEVATVEATMLHFKNVLTRRLWSRIWIVQEIAVATELSIVCGDSRVAWDDLLSAMHHHVLILSENVSAPSLPNPTSAVSTGLAMSHRNLMILQDIKIKVNQRQPFSFRDGLEKTRTFHATDPRDRVYALLGITHDSHAFVRVPDYRISVDEMHMQMTRNYIRLTKSLDIIVCGGLMQNETGAYTLPTTWSAHWHNLGPEAEYLFSTAANRRFNADCTSHNYRFNANAAGAKTYMHLEVEGAFLQQVDGLDVCYDAVDASGDIAHHPRLTRHIFANRFGLAYWAERNRTIASHVAISRNLRYCLYKGIDLNTSSNIANPTLFLRYRGLSAFDKLLKGKILHGQRAQKSDRPQLNRWLTWNSVVQIRDCTLKDFCTVPVNASVFKRTFISAWIIIFAESMWQSGGSPQYKSASYALFYYVGLTSTKPSWIMTLLLPIFVATTELLVNILDRGDLAVHGGALSYLMLLAYRTYRQEYQEQLMFLEKFDRCMKRRRLRLATLGRGRYDDCTRAGLPLFVPNETRRGDHFVIIKHCSILIILREYKDRFQLIGMAYLEDAMWGGMIRPDQRWTKFELH